MMPAPRCYRCRVDGANDRTIHRTAAFMALSGVRRRVGSGSRIDGRCKKRRQTAYGRSRPAPTSTAQIPDLFILLSSPPESLRWLKMEALRLE
jgi:hypothetical protein